MANKKVSKDSWCLTCEYFDEEDCSCLAFPDGIPQKFIDGTAKHDRVSDGQVIGRVYFEKPPTL